MKTQTKKLVPVIIIVAMQLFISCQKNNELTGKSMNANSVDNSIHTLPADSTLVAWYPFHHGKLVDKSGYGNKIIFCTATPAISKSGQDSDAYYFDGTSSYMMVRNDASLNPAQGITLAALVKPMGFYKGKCHFNRILSKEFSDFTSGRYSLGFGDLPFNNYQRCDSPARENKERFYGVYGNEGINADNVTDTDYVKTNHWYTLVYTCDRSVAKLYVNNKLVNAVEVSASPFDSRNERLYIGANQEPGYPYYFNGVIDEIRIYNRALSSDEVINLNTLMGK